MIEGGHPLGLRGELTNSLERALGERVLNARVVELLSSRDDKRVEVVEEPNGYRLVRRSYSRAAIDDIVNKAGLPFTKAWVAMHDIFRTAGIDIVPSIMFRPSSKESDFPIVVASEYLEDGNVRASSTEAKVQMATGLGAILCGSSEFFPSMTFMPDMFRVERDQTGADRLVLVDIDPYLIVRSTVIKDIWDATYIGKMSRLLWDDWCEPNERRRVVTAFVSSIGPMLDHEGPRTFDAFAKVHLMSQGFDPDAFS
ncbi:MAG: hypothetical protein Q7S60_00315 [bacterium]|nr:hypothetical protein [bacterium]